MSEDIKYNKLVNPETLKSADKVSGNIELETSGIEVEEDNLSSETLAFLHSMSQDDFLNRVYLGRGPHSKVRTAIKVSDVIPSRASSTNPETFFDVTLNVYYDSEWNEPTVGLQATAEQFVTPTDTPNITSSIIYNVNGGSDQTIGTPSLYARHILNGFTATGDYTLRVRYQGTTTVGAGKPLYLTGAAPRQGIWAGTPSIDPSGIITYDMTIQMPEVPGIEDWDVEVAEV